MTALNTAKLLIKSNGQYPGVYWGQDTHRVLSTGETYISLTTTICCLLPCIFQCFPLYSLYVQNSNNIIMNINTEAETWWFWQIFKLLLTGIYSQFLVECSYAVIIHAFSVVCVLWTLKRHLLVYVGFWLFADVIIILNFLYVILLFSFAQMWDNIYNFNGS